MTRVWVSCANLTPFLNLDVNLRLLIFLLLLDRFQNTGFKTQGWLAFFEIVSGFHEVFSLLIFLGADLNLPLILDWVTVKAYRIFVDLFLAV